MKIKKGDTVKVLYGRDSGKIGKVLRVLRKDQKIVVDGVNMFKKHVKGDGQSKASEIITISKPLHSSKVMLIDPKDNKPTRVKMGVDATGNKVRESVKSGVSLDQQKEVRAKEKSTVESKEKPKTKEKTTTEPEKSTKKK